MAASASRSPEGVREHWQHKVEPIPDGWGHAWEAWGELTTCRQLSMAGPGPVPWTAIAAWAAAADMGRQDEEELRFIIRRLDNIFLEHVRNRSK